MPCLERSIPPDQAADRVSIEQDSESDSDYELSDTEQETKSPALPAPRKECQDHQRHTSCALWKGPYTQHNHFRTV